MFIRHLRSSDLCIKSGAATATLSSRDWHPFAEHEQKPRLIGAFPPVRSANVNCQFSKRTNLAITQNLVVDLCLAYGHLLFTPCGRRHRDAHQDNQQYKTPPPSRFQAKSLPPGPSPGSDIGCLGRPGRLKGPSGPPSQPPGRHRHGCHPPPIPGRLNSGTRSTKQGEHAPVFNGAIWWLN